MLKKLRNTRLKGLISLAVILLGAFSATLSPFLEGDSSAATLSTRTGYYVGTGATVSISGLGFQPQYLVIKGQNTNTGVIKTKDMPGDAVAMGNNTADSTGVTIDSDGFTMSSSITANVSGDMYIYVAFAGSDCSSGGNVCIGTYTGNGSGTRVITTGFQPGLIIEKSNSTQASHFKTASMPTNHTDFLFRQVPDTTGAYLGAITSSGFTVGTQNNVNARVYYYIAIKSGGGLLAEGTYTGDGVDNRDITGVGFKPSMVLVKNSNSASSNNTRPLWNTRDHFGDTTSYFGDAVGGIPNAIQLLQNDGFQIGSSVNTNESGMTHYWFALGGDTSAPTASGTFKMARGSYTGTGSALSVSSLGFKPDLIFVKDNSTNGAVFKTSMMPGDITAYTALTTADFTGGITSIDSDGFSIGTSAVLNTSAQTYHWQAFGGAYNPYTRTGASDFAVGAYHGNALAREITGQPFQPDFVAAKRGPGTGQVLQYKTTSFAGDASASLGSAADVTNAVLGFNTDGFRIGTSANVNGLGNLTRWFAFKAGTNFSVGDYTGDGIMDKAISSPGVQPDLVWVKRSGQLAVQRPSSLAGDNSQYFVGTANASGRIKSLTSTGFTLGINAEVNTSGANYRFVSWRIPPSGSLSTNIVDAGGSSVPSPNFSMSSLGFLFECSTSTATIGENTQRLRVSNTTASPIWSLSIAPTDGSTALWRNGGNTQQYDLNDPTSLGCVDGADGDSKAGSLAINPSTGSLSPQLGCSNSNISTGSSSAFNEGVLDSLTLLSSSSSANTGCYWDLTGVTVGQKIPADQLNDSYSLNLTITVSSF